LYEKVDNQAKTDLAWEPPKSTPPAIFDWSWYRTRFTLTENGHNHRCNLFVVLRPQYNLKPKRFLLLVDGQELLAVGARPAADLL